MYNYNDKRRLYWLIDQYLAGVIDETKFCNEFYYSYDLELEGETLTNYEKLVFDELSQVSSRFSKYEEDHKLNARAFSSVEELRKKILETHEKLNDNS